MYINNVIKLHNKTEADLFSSKPMQNSIESSTTIEYRPVSTGLDDLIEFVIPEGPHYVDLSLMKLHIKVKIRDSTGAVVKHEFEAPVGTATVGARKGVHVSPINNFMSSLFNNVQIFLNHKCITPPGGNYHFRSYIEKLTNYGKESKKTHLTSAMYYEDKYDEFDNFENEGSLARMARIGKNGSIEMQGYLHTDISSSNKLMLNNINIRLKLYRNKPSFSLMTNKDPAGEYRIEITDAVLLVRKVQVNPNVAISNETFLRTTNARYCIERVEIKTFTIPSGTVNKTLDNCFISQMPKRLLMMSVEEGSEFSYRKNPYKFHHNNLSLVLLSGDNFTNLRPIKTNYDNEEFMEAYTSFNEAINTYFHDNSAGITPEAFKHSSCIVGYDLTPDLSASQDHISIQKSGVLRLELNYSKPLPKSIKVILYAEFENFINIDYLRNVYTDYAA